MMGIYVVWSTLNPVMWTGNTYWLGLLPFWNGWLFEVEILGVMSTVLSGCDFLAAWASNLLLGACSAFTEIK